MIAIILKCDKTGEEENVTERYGCTSLKQCYYMIVNGEIDGREVKKESDGYKHYNTK